MSYLNTMYNEEARPITDYPNQLVLHLRKRFNLSGHVLDAGCGRGDFAMAFLQRGLTVTSIDGESHPGGLQGIDFDNSAFPSEDQTFDVVFSKSVIEHLSNPEHYLAECLRVLKPGGRLIILTPDWLSQHEIFYDDPTHRRPYTTRTIENALKIAGFQNVEAERFHQLPLVWEYPILKSLCWILRKFIPVRWKLKTRFIRWSIELMVLGTGVKDG